MRLLMTLALACRQPAPQPGPDAAAFMLAPPPGPITILFLGQSNCNQAHSVNVASVPPEVVNVHNGTELVTGNPYPSLYGPQANMTEDLILAGYTEIYVISECYNGRTIQSLVDLSMPLLAASVSATQALYPAMPDPTALVLVHGEQDATNESLAELYQARLVGPRPDPNVPALLEIVDENWPGIEVLITEVRVRSDGQYPYHHWTRAAQHHAGLLHGVCLIPTGGPEWDGDCALRGSTNPHYSTAGLECIGGRIAQALVDGTCP